MAHSHLPDEPTVTLFRPVGQEELELVRASDWRAWPPRLPGQTILEYWIPAEDLAQLNASIVGTIDVIAAYTGPASGTQDQS